MLKRYVSSFAWAMLVPAVVLAQQAHPDLSGAWSYAIDRAPAALKKTVNGVVTIQKIDQSARHGDARSVAGALPSTPGYVGIYQFVAVSVLSPFGFSRTDAIAYILFYQAVSYLVVLTWGLIALANSKPAPVKPVSR